MTYNQMAEMFTTMGWAFTTEIVDVLEKGGNIKKLANGMVQILDFKGFAKAMKIDTSTPEFADAFKSYNDAMIDRMKATRDNVLEEINSIPEAKPGDILNLSALSAKMGSGLFK